MALGSAVPDQKYLVFEVELMLAGNDVLQGDIAITMPKQTLAEGQSGVDTKLYVDHVKLYTTDTK